MPWSEADLYGSFLEVGILPEQVRNMAAYDVYMILYGRVARYINDEANKAQPARAASYGEVKSALNPRSVAHGR